MGACLFVVHRQSEAASTAVPILTPRGWNIFELLSWAMTSRNFRGVFTQTEENKTMQSFSPIVLALALFAGSSTADFTNVTHLETTDISFGSATANDAQSCFFAGSDGGISGVFSSYDSGNTMEYTAVQPGPLISMALAADEDSNVLASGLLGAIVSTDAGQTYTSIMSSLPYPLAACQDVKYSSGKWTMTGTFFDKEVSDGIVYSADLSEWTHAEVPGLHVQGSLRYGSMPSDTTIYATAGFWNDTDVPGTVKLSKRISVHASDRITKFDSAAMEASSSSGTDYGWWTQVVKSSDAGKTWDFVYESMNEGYYPNDIHCYDENTCMFVMEGLYSPKAMLTTDGGNTWTNVLTDDTSVSLMSARMLSATEAWVAGGGDVGRMWHSEDLSNWDASTTELTDAASLTSFVVDATQRVIYATGVLRSQLTSMLRMTY